MLEKLNTKLSNAYWDYRAEYANHNGYKKQKEITPAIAKRLDKMVDIINQIKSL